MSEEKRVPCCVKRLPPKGVLFVSAWNPRASSERQRLTISVGLVRQLTVQSPKCGLEMYAHVRACKPPSTRPVCVQCSGQAFCIWEKKRPAYACVTKWVVTSTAKPQWAQPVLVPPGFAADLSDQHLRNGGLWKDKAEGQALVWTVALNNIRPKIQFDPV